VKFATYAWNYVKGRMLEELRLAHIVPMSKRAALGKTAVPVRPPIMVNIPQNDVNGDHVGNRGHSEFCFRNGLVQNDTTENDIDRRAQREAVRKRLRRLESAELRRVGFRALSGQSAADIAAALGMTEPKVARHLRQLADALTRRRS
jgi:DNA-directed RNA polymerase specialized sigma subunit